MAVVLLSPAARTAATVAYLERDEVSDVSWAVGKSTSEGEQDYSKVVLTV